MKINININPQELSKINRPKKYDLGNVVTTMQDLLDNSEITIEDNLLPILVIDGNNYMLPDLETKYSKLAKRNIFNIQENDLISFDGAAPDLTGYATEDWVLANTPQGDYLGTITPTSTPTGSGANYWNATQPGTYTNFGGVVVAANSMAIISRDASGNFSISQTALDLSTYAQKTQVLNESAISLGLDSVSIDNDFSSNLTEFQSFNGGVISLDTGRLKVVASTDAKGVGIKPAYVENAKEHTVIFEVDLGTCTSVVFYNKWANIIKTITVSGIYEITFTSDNSGVFPYPIISAGSTGTFYLNFLKLKKTNLLRDYALVRELNAVKNQLPTILYQNDFSSNFTNLASFNGGVLSLDTNRLKVVASALNKGVEFRTIVNAEDYTIEFDIDLNGLPLVNFYSYWQNKILTITSSGKVKFTFTNAHTGGLPYPCLAPEQAGTFYIDNVKITQNENSVSKYELEQVRKLSDISGGNSDYRVQLGKEAVASLNKQVIIGGKAKSDQTDATVIGYNADGNAITLWGCQSDNEHTQIGDNSRGGGWRTTNVGSKSYPLGQSSSVYGAGAESTVSHGLALGRGSMMNWFSNGVALGGVGNRTLYMGSGWGHRFRTPLSSISVGYNTPSTESITIGGINAFDYRPYQYSALKSYTQYEEVVYNGQLYLSKVSANLGNTPPTMPTISNSYWTNITSLLIGHTEYYPPVLPLIYVSTITAWTSGYAGQIGRFVSHLGVYYIRQSVTDNTTAPASNTDYINVSTNWNATNSRLECGYFKDFNPLTYAVGQMTVKWECVWISKIAGNTNVPPSTRVSDANWHCVYDPTGLITSWLIGMSGVNSYDTRHDYNVIGGDLNVDGGKGTGTNKSGKVNFRTKKANPSETDGNKQQSLEVAGQFHSETGTDTRFRLLDNATGVLKDVKYYVDGSGRKILYID